MLELIPLVGGLLNSLAHEPEGKKIVDDLAIVIARTHSQLQANGLSEDAATAILSGMARTTGGKR